MPNTRSSRGVQQRIAIRHAYRPYERRNVGILSSEAADAITPGSTITPEACRCRTYFTRERVKQLVANGEMRWLDRHHNLAAWTALAAATWQKTKSGPVHTMQLVTGLKGRAVPANHREREEVQA